MAGAFSRKASGISCDLTAFRKIKELRANAVETPLGVTGLLLLGLSLFASLQQAGQILDKYDNLNMNYSYLTTINEKDIRNYTVVLKMTKSHTMIIFVAKIVNSIFLSEIGTLNLGENILIHYCLVHRDLTNDLLLQILRCGLTPQSSPGIRTRCFS